MRRKTLSVKIGKVFIGSDHSIKTQSMTTASTMDTDKSVDEAIRIIQAGGKLVRFTAPNINEAKNLLNIKNALVSKGYDDPLVADIHFTPNAALEASKIVEKGIAQVMEGRRIFSELSVVENLRLGGHTNSANIQNNIDRVLDMFPALKDRQKGEAGYLSGGEQQMLAIGRALMSEPEYLLLDEPSLGLAPKLVDQIAELIQEINKQGVTVLLVEQNANMALNISDHGYIMETGNIVMDNDSKKLLNDEDVREFYLGLNAEGTKRKSFKDVKHYKRKKRWLS